MAEESNAEESNPKMVLNINTLHTSMVGLQLGIGEKAMIRTMLEMVSDMYAKTFDKPVAEVDEMVQGQVNKFTREYAQQAQKYADSVKNSTV